MHTTTVLPPQIAQYFSRTLRLNLLREVLSLSSPKFREDSQDLHKFYEYALHIFRKKIKSGKIPSKEKKCLALINEYLELYERIKIKEKDIEANEKHCTKGPFYSFGCIDKKGEEIWRRSRFKSLFYKLSAKCRRNNAIQAIQ